MSASDFFIWFLPLLSFVLNDFFSKNNKKYRYGYPITVLIIIPGVAKKAELTLPACLPACLPAKIIDRSDTLMSTPLSRFSAKTLPPIPLYYI
jgi:hypothetical protein